ncbi:thiamine-phosphate kinase [Silvibacterium dinghuense]|uniref:Thiamine-monophosphate kinase n=1 Tax=Silvibacterium dinghuense TaxID=1560006 RepID=A0A4Q1SJU3_9BACT|nr:thiamine-phosphate kinase [Silvibacterium dinghuense]RXS97709.1 thiamine-monophosphate kinase [Silvibacterium dinghuense]GGH01337.1 thiamine-monophosphate kinase [Silvibacterium dinghuense]
MAATRKSRSALSVSVPPPAPGGERAFIARLRAEAEAHRGRHAGLRLGIGDDCAILRPPAGHDVVVTTDFSLEQVHFRRDWHPPESVGHRCLARGLSDLAAMGATPLGAFLSIALPPELAVAAAETMPKAARRKASGARAASLPGSLKPESWFDRFLAGFLALAEKEHVPLAGGDTAQSPSFDFSGHKQSGLAAADITLVGAVPRGHALLRSAARPGDVIYVTGALGGSAAELLALGRSPQDFAARTLAAAHHPHLYPQPRLAAARRLVAGRRLHAGIDLSDGLSTDLAHICEESGVAAELDTSAIPIHKLARDAQQDGWVPSALSLALHGGEDYELLFTAPRWTKIPRTIAGVSLHPIGEIVKPRRNRPSVILRESDGSQTPLDSGGWEHFRGD